MFGGVAEPVAAEGFRSGLNSMDDKLVYMGVTICKSNHLPTEDYAELDQNDDPVPGAAIGELQRQRFRHRRWCRGLIWMPELSRARKTGLVVDTEDDIRRNTTFTVASMMSGTGMTRAAKILGQALLVRLRAERPLASSSPVPVMRPVSTFFGYEKA